jgi:hypothetical protein
MVEYEYTFSKLMQNGWTISSLYFSMHKTNPSSDLEFLCGIKALPFVSSEAIFVYMLKCIISYVITEPELFAFFHSSAWLTSIVYVYSTMVVVMASSL